MRRKMLPFVAETWSLRYSGRVSGFEKRRRWLKLHAESLGKVESRSLGMIVSQSFSEDLTE